MKNNFKKCLALLLSVVMILAMSVSVFATDSNQNGDCTLTITNGSGNTYSVYQIASFDVGKVTEDGKEKTVYTNIVVADAYKTAFSIDDVKTQEHDNEYMKALANTLAKIETAPIVSGVTDGVVSGLKTGYYLVKETAHAANDANLATKYILVAVDGTGENKNTPVTLKTSTADITKKIVLEDSATNVSNAEAGTLVDENVVAIGDTVTYQIDSTIPEYPSYATEVTYVITDTMSTGLTPCDEATVKVEIKAVGSDNYETYTEATVKKEGQKFTISIPAAKVLATPGGAVRVTLTGQLNDQAQIGSTGNPNSVDLEYTNNWDEKTTHKTDEDTVITYTGELNIKKVDSVDKNKTLEGAEFAIYGPKNYSAQAPDGVGDTISIGEAPDAVTYYYHSTITTDKDGKAKITGLDAGTYYAVETSAPEGYSVDSTPQEIVLSVYTDSKDNNKLEISGDPVTPSGNTNEVANTNAATTYQATWDNTEVNPKQIENTQGVTLPGTGGIGTTIFTVGGLALVVLAGVLFIVYMKKQKRQA